MDQAQEAVRQASAEVYALAEEESEQQADMKQRKLAAQARLQAAERDLEEARKRAREEGSIDG